MFKNSLLTAWRSIIKNKVYSIINILGLAVGMAAFLLIALYARHEINYDGFHENKDNIYRVQQNRYNKGELTTQWAAGCAGIGPALKENFAEVEEFVKLHGTNVVLQFEEKVFKEERTYYATSNFFEVFSVKLIEGIDSLVLREPYSVVLSKSSAKKYFGDQDPIGETIKQNGRTEFTVTGVYEDISSQSHMAADMLYSFESFVDMTNEGARDRWDWDGFYTYVTLLPNTNQKDFEAKIPDFVVAKWGEEMAQSNHAMKFSLQPIKDIHLYSDYMYEMKANGDGKATYFLLIIAFFIIIIAWVNYINLSTSKSMERAKEVGIRKVLGSMRQQITRQFLTESFLLNFLAMILGFILMVAILPYFRTLSGINLTMVFTDGFLWLTLVVLFIVGGFLSGLYPALVLSGFKPATVLKGKLSGASGGVVLRKSLVVFQFIASLVLMVGTVTVFEQLQFMKNQDLGVNIDQTLIVKGPNITDSLYNDNFLAFKHAVSNYSAVATVASSTSIPGSQPGWNAGGIRLIEQPETEGNQYRIIGVDGDFIGAFGLEMLAGRMFDEERTQEHQNVLFNESAVKLLGFTPEEALQREIFFWGDTFKIVGVLKNYHQESLKKSFEPLVFRYMHAAGFYSIKVQSTNMSETIELVEEEWQAMFPGNPFEYFFLDDHFNQQYKAELQFGKVFGLFTGLAIFIACLGLFGLASYTTLQRTKEIGVRKVLGASVPSILMLLSKDFSRLIIIAIVLSTPVSWYLIHQWLLGFANKIYISWWLFGLPALVLMFVALATVSFQTIKSAQTNPVQCLRDD